MKKLQLTNSWRHARVDDEDFELLNEERWQLQPNGAIARGISLGGRGTSRTIYLHRVIMNAPSGMCVDHRNHDKLNNQKNNLRIATKRQNAHNSLKQKPETSSRFKGVYLPSDFASRKKPWRAYINLPYGMIILGSFETETEAAQSYNRAAKKHFGKFALLNEL
jgi:hypothetical protein